MADTPTSIEQLQGPILVLGASGFVGANLFQSLFRVRQDVYGSIFTFPSWRLQDVPSKNVFRTDLIVPSNLRELLDKVAPKTIFNCVAFGAYSFETDANLIYQTNFNATSVLLNELGQRDITAYVHAGSSSEYGANCRAPKETDPLMPNSDYAVSKAACAHLIWYHGKQKNLPCANLRLYSVYGPMEDSSRLLPRLIMAATEGGYPPLVNPDISRDFVYTDDVSRAFINTALHMNEDVRGESINIGSGVKTTIGDLARIAKETFHLNTDPEFSSHKPRKWDLNDWYGNPEKAKKLIHWESQTDLAQGLEKMMAWYQGFSRKNEYLKLTKAAQLDSEYSVSAIIACYKDGQAIPIMYERLTKVFRRAGVDYEIIFVNDCSPDDSESVITELSSRDRRVVGISHARNFGSQAAFRSGMAISSKKACVLLDGDLQDPPELIEEFIAKWREGYNVVYGRRVGREASLFMRTCYKLFYRLFNFFSYVDVPKDAGDFSLMDRNVVDWILKFPERDMFLRGMRAFIGFKQTGIDYVRPERMFGRTTNSLLKNIGWAKKGILSFSNVPLNILSFVGVAIFLGALAFGVVHVGYKVFFPESAPHGITTVILIIILFGSMNLVGMSLIGEYIAKIFEESKRRPHYIRRGIIKDGELRESTSR